MAHHVRAETFSGPISLVSDAGPTGSSDSDLVWPFGNLEGLDKDDIREAAYEVFFTACRSSPGFGGGKNALSFYSRDHHGVGHHEAVEGGGGGGGGSPSGRVGSGPVVVMTPTSRIKRALGLKMLRRSPSRRMSTSGASLAPSGPGSPSTTGSTSPAIGFSTVPGPSRPRRPMTSAEIMRLQMGVTEQSDNRLRKTLMRTLVGQVR